MPATVHVSIPPETVQLPDPPVASATVIVAGSQAGRVELPL